MKQSAYEAKIWEREAKRRDTRINDHPTMLDEPTDHAVAQTTRWCWRPLARRSGNILQTRQSEVSTTPSCPNQGLHLNRATQQSGEKGSGA